MRIENFSDQAWLNLALQSKISESPKEAAWLGASPESSLTWQQIGECFENWRNLFFGLGVNQNTHVLFVGPLTPTAAIIGWALDSVGARWISVSDSVRGPFFQEVVKNFLPDVCVCPKNWSGKSELGSIPLLPYSDAWGKIPEANATPKNLSSNSSKTIRPKKNALASLGPSGEVIEYGSEVLADGLKIWMGLLERKTQDFVLAVGSKTLDPMVRLSLWLGLVFNKKILFLNSNITAQTLLSRSGLPLLPVMSQEFFLDWVRNNSHIFFGRIPGRMFSFSGNISPKIAREVLRGWESLTYRIQSSVEPLFGADWTEAQLLRFKKGFLSLGGLNKISQKIPEIFVYEGWVEGPAPDLFRKLGINVNSALVVPQILGPLALGYSLKHSQRFDCVSDTRFDLNSKGNLVFRTPRVAEPDDKEGFSDFNFKGKRLSEREFEFYGKSDDIFTLESGIAINTRKIKSVFSQDPLLGRTFVFGEQRPYVGALFTVRSDSARLVAGQLRIPFSSVSDLIDHPVFLEEVKSRVKYFNSFLRSEESIRRYVLISHDFTVEGGEVEGDGRLNVKFCLEKYKNHIDQLYQGSVV